MTAKPLSAIRPEVRKTPRRMMVYGFPGVGKTTLAASIPGAVFICAEANGADELAVARYPEPISDLAGLHTAIERLRLEKHDFTELVIDKLDDVEQWVFAAVMTRDPRKPASIDLVFGGYDKGPNAAVDEWRRLAAELEKLQAARGMGITLIAGCTRHKFKNPGGADYQMWGPNIHLKASEFLRGWCKDVLFAYVEGGAYEHETKKWVGGSTGVRLLRTRYDAAHVAKNRHGLKDPMPLDWLTLDAAMSGREVEAPAVIAERIKSKLAEIGDDVLTANVSKHIAAAKDSPAMSVIENKVNAIAAERKGATP